MDSSLDVNGQDVSRSSHEDAVRAFQSADEPIVVEVLRRAQPSAVHNGSSVPSNGGHGAVSSPRCETAGAGSPELVSTAVQTDWMGAWELSDTQETLNNAPPTHMYVIPEAEPDESYEEEDLAQEIMDYEEVTLQKSGGRGERLGLTLCYSSVPSEADDDVPDTEVFISAVEHGGVASRDGRLREGDQILQVNGVDVTTKEQAEALFAASKDADFDDDLEDGDADCCFGTTSFIQDVPTDVDEACVPGAAAASEIASNPSHQDIAKHSSTSVTTVAAEPGYLGSAETTPEDKSQCKASSVPDAGCSTPNKTGMAIVPAQRLDLIDQELYQLNKKMEIIQLECESIAAHHSSNTIAHAPRPFGDSETEHIYETIPEQTESEAEPIYSLPYEPEPIQTPGQQAAKTKVRCVRSVDPLVKASKQEDVEQWVKLSGTDPRAVREGESWLKKESWPHSVESRSSNESRRRQTGDAPARSKGKGSNKCKDSSSGDDKEKDSSSAYNTGESCRSTPLTLELGLTGDPSCGRSESTLVLCPPPPSASTEDRSMQVNLDSDTYSVISCESCRRCMRLPPLSSDHAPSPTTSPKKPYREQTTPKQQNDTEKNLNYVTMIPSDTMYTNAANLQQTIWLQQQLFRQALTKQHSKTSPSSTVSPKSPNAPFMEQTRKTIPACSPANSSYLSPNLSNYQFVSGYGIVNGLPSACTLPSPHSQTSGPMTKTAQQLHPQQSHGPDTMEMEWKVKRRPDGSRYIARRPIGRYWTREERKKHLEKAKEKRKRQEAVIRAKMQTGKETQDQDLQAKGEERVSSSKKKQINTIEVSHKKMARKKSAKDTFEDFTAVQEMLVHGNRIAAGPGTTGGSKMLGLLSVTTV
ncbi:hypothetical protein B566_EDAN002647 [Ephemera danica]|nr:hypothetical protein B566_EDAN002647 [Ephemera danica]